MLILLEGADGSGKTTLCKQLKEFGFNVEPTVSRSETNPYEQWIKLINKGDATSEDVLTLMVMMFNAVKNQYTIELQPEIIFIGDIYVKKSIYQCKCVGRIRR